MIHKRWYAIKYQLKVSISTEKYLLESFFFFVNVFNPGMKYVICSKSVEIKTLFKMEMKNNQNSPLGIQHTYSRYFSIGRCSSEFPLLRWKMYKKISIGI